MFEETITCRANSKWTLLTCIFKMIKNTHYHIAHILPLTVINADESAAGLKTA